MEIDLPFKAEYAKTGRSSCRKCKSPIGQGVLRIAVMVQSRHFDGKQPNWFHEKCFFIKQRPGGEGDIEGFEILSPADQKRLREGIAAISNGESSSKNVKGKGKKRTKNASDVEALSKVAIKDFGIEYAKSSRSECCGCRIKISKNELRIKKIVYDTEVGMKYGGQPLWHHAECFAKLRAELGWFQSGVNVPGYMDLEDTDQENIKKLLPAIKSSDLPPEKKVKLEVKTEKEVKEDKKLIEKIEKQTKLLHKARQYVQHDMKKSDVVRLLEANGQKVPTGDTGKLYDLAADVITFGALSPCTNCTNGQFIFNKSGYLCTGDATEWSKCMNRVTEPKRFQCKLSSDLLEKYPFLNKKGKPIVRAIHYIPPSEIAIKMSGSVVKKEEELEPKIKRERPPLYTLQFVIHGLKKEEAELKKTIESLGGKVVKSVHSQLAAVISTPEEVEKVKGKIATAKELGIQVVPKEYLDEIKESKVGAISYIVSKSICDWGTDPHSRIPQENKSASKKSVYEKSVPKSMKLKLKQGTAVDPDSGLDDVAHVYIDGNDKYNAILSKTDIQKNKNSYYKLQLLQSDNGKRFWIFRAWGRIGTTIGGKKVESFSGLYDALNSFKSLYTDQTGNDWENRDNFVKIPGLYYPVDIDYGEDDKVNTFNVESKVASKLAKPVQELIKLIFDVEMMKKTLLEFEIDMEKMPLGKISKSQIQKAYTVLTELSQLIQNGGSSTKFVDGTNRFYTLIPHSFGMAAPPLLDTNEKIQHHVEMLDSLMEIECAYSMLSSEDSNVEINPIDKHYEQLKTELNPVDKNSDEFKLLESYVQNTHAETHRMYDLEIVEIFKVARQGEARRFKPFKKLHNRKLLWHGSRLTNYAGILSHGLKIAPPEAPVTGYMFGKGIYFADMVSKSANYCCTSKQNPTGLLLLSEVACGNIVEYPKSHYVTKLPKDKHSVKGIGRTQPNPAESIKREDGVEIPLGKPITDTKVKSSLLYNEFIVYDVAQANVQYLFRVEFKYKY